MTTRKKLIEVALPLDAINAASQHEKDVHTGLPANLHAWWARRPLAACRAVIFTSLVDDPEQPGCPQELLDAIDQLLPDSSGEKSHRERLFDFIGELVKWENTTNDQVIGTARELIIAATGGNPPPLLDPFCGGGSIPLEAQRLGLEAHASELNPVAVLITKALVEIPAKFNGRPPVNPDARKQMGQDAAWNGAAGLAADVRWYGNWIRDRARERIGHLYPKGPDGEEVIAWRWARAVKCPNPACGAEMPLVRSFWLSTQKSKEAWVEPIVDGKVVRFEVRTSAKPSVEGTMRRVGAECLICGSFAPVDWIRSEAQAGRMGQQLMAIVTEGQRSRTYLAPTEEHTVAAASACPAWKPDEPIPTPSHDVDRLPMYGMPTWGDAFTPRQLVALTTFCDLVGEARSLALEDARAAGLTPDGIGMADGGTGATAYADAVATYLAFAVDRLAQTNSTLIRWLTRKSGPSKGTPAFDRHAVPMVWDFSEGDVFGKSVGSWDAALTNMLTVFRNLPTTRKPGRALQLDSTTALPDVKARAAVATDPPYYDNIGYADLSDFFYVWLRRALGKLYPDLFSTVLTPKTQELIAAPHRFDGDREAADRHFEEGLTKAFTLIRDQANPEYPVTIYYAFKQAEESDDGNGRLVVASTGWQTMLDGLLRTGFQIVGTWPIRTEGTARIIAIGTNALASSIVLVCRPRPSDAPIATRREFQSALREELSPSLRVLTGHGSTHPVSPVDLAQASIGPGMAVFSRYSKVLEASGDAMSVRTALQVINQAIEDYFTEQEGALDADTQFSTRWFEQHGLSEGPFGDAETLAKAKNIGIDAMARNGVLEARAGKVRLQPLAYYLEGAAAYDPVADRRPTVWEACHYLIAALDSGGEAVAARLARRLGGLAERARDLAYRLYDICDRKGWAEPALGYNALVSSWPEIQKEAARLAVETQAELI